MRSQRSRSSTSARCVNGTHCKPCRNLPLRWVGDSFHLRCWLLTPLFPLPLCWSCSYDSYQQVIDVRRVHPCLCVCVCVIYVCVCVHAQGSKIDKGISLSSFGAHTTWLLIPAFAGRASNVSLGKICFRRTAPLFSRVRCHWVEEAYSIAGIRPVSPVSSHSM